MPAEIDKSVFTNYPIDTYGEIWKELSPLPFTKKTGLPPDSLCFLQMGTIRKYIVNAKEDVTEDISVDFYFAGTIFTANTAKDAENAFIFEPISSGMLWHVDMRVVRRLFEESKLCATTQKVFLEEQLRQKTIREIQLLRASPKEIYLYLLRNKPYFLENVPLKYLASYIGITPQALSRIRKQIY